MLDVVVNHNGWNGSIASTDYSKFHPFNEKKYYHPYCPIVDWSNQTQVENCWMGDNIVPLSDLYTQRADVQQGYQSWISTVVHNYSGMSVPCLQSRLREVMASHMLLSSRRLENRYG
jgi:alpha-amylase